MMQIASWWLVWKSLNTYFRCIWSSEGHCCKRLEVDVPLELVMADATAKWRGAREDLRGQQWLGRYSEVLEYQPLHVWKILEVIEVTPCNSHVWVPWCSTVATKLPRGAQSCWRSWTMMAICWRQTKHENTKTRWNWQNIKGKAYAKWTSYMTL